MLQQESRMKVADKDGKRLDTALTEMNKLMQTVFSYMIVFGELTAILVFIIMFISLATNKKPEIIEETETPIIVCPDILFNEYFMIAETAKLNLEIEDITSDMVQRVLNGEEIKLPEEISGNE